MPVVSMTKSKRVITLSRPADINREESLVEQIWVGRLTCWVKVATQGSFFSIRLWTRTELSSEDEDRYIVPAGLYTIENVRHEGMSDRYAYFLTWKYSVWTTPVCSLKQCVQNPFNTSHNLIVLSADPVATKVPDESYAIDWIGMLCALIDLNRLDSSFKLKID